ncbi:uncharacterized protein FIBRA_01317 [Fibroporia radiculosa]|uniref:Chromosome transmission fidelity protein 8 n=1 Tax=Fibroporia radiculosa TaxID=599839 RepID=J4I8F1_9APHY|nr:uncharacterized protein FIBRA_01317 [Fibroporia radiculosa]CCL99301.1 predicted protein [Fibroporia radiculosa]
MTISINIFHADSLSSTRTFSPQLAQFGGDEMVLIEMQGSLEVEGNKDGQTVGKLRIDEITKKPTLLIGHHLLEGKLVNLPKPLAVLHRQAHGRSRTEDVEMEDDIRTLKVEAEWDIVAVVKRKMIFSKRPMPMVGKHSTASETKPIAQKT